jgi:hypothetical protein
VRQRIAGACARAGRSPADVTLLLATKTVPAERLATAVRAGATLFGENRVQELQAKVAALRRVDPAAGEAAAWHLIGHLQTNKIKHALPLVSCIQSVDRPRLIDRLEQRLAREDRCLDVYLQVNTSGEASKYGVPPEGAPALVQQIQRAPHLRLHGLMTLGRLGATPEAARPGFAALRRLRDDMIGTGELDARQDGLSMGMSGDFEVAVEEGATLVRVGSAVFGPRETPDSAYWPGD